jgi:hypothetical protein
VRSKRLTIAELVLCGMGDRNALVWRRWGDRSFAQAVGAIVLCCGQGCGAIAGHELGGSGGLALAELEFRRGQRLG